MHAVGSDRRPERLKQRSGHDWPVVAAIILATVAMAVGAVSWRPLFIAAGIGGCVITWWAWRRGRSSFTLVFGTAVVLRILVFPLAPVLSDDAYRYIWDGRLSVEGVNPYQDRKSVV